MSDLFVLVDSRRTFARVELDSRDRLVPEGWSGYPVAPGDVCLGHPYETWYRWLGMELDLAAGRGTHPSTPRGIRISEVLDLAFQTTRALPPALLAAAVLLNVPVMAASAAVLRSSTDPAAIWAVIGMESLWAFPAAVLVLAIVRVHRGDRPTAAALLHRTLLRSPAVLSSTLLMMAGVGVGLVALVVPGVALMAWWFVAIPAVMVEERGGWDSLRRSAELTSGHTWGILGTFGTLLVMLWLLDRGVSNAEGLTAAWPWIGVSLWIAIDLFALLASSALVAAWYIALRTRKEGYDVEIRADSLGRGASAIHPAS